LRNTQAPNSSFLCLIAHETRTAGFARLTATGNPEWRTSDAEEDTQLELLADVEDSRRDAASIPLRGKLRFPVRLFDPYAAPPLWSGVLVAFRPSSSVRDCDFRLLSTVHHHSSFINPTPHIPSANLPFPCYGLISLCCFLRSPSSMTGSLGFVKSVSYHAYRVLMLKLLLFFASVAGVCTDKSFSSRL